MRTFQTTVAFVAELFTRLDLPGAPPADAELETSDDLEGLFYDQKLNMADGGVWSLGWNPIRDELDMTTSFDGSDGHAFTTIYFNERVIVIVLRAPEPYPLKYTLLWSITVTREELSNGIPEVELERLANAIWSVDQEIENMGSALDGWDDYWDNSLY